MDNGGSEVLSYKVRFEDQAGNLTSITVDAGDMWDLQELQVAYAATVCRGSAYANASDRPIYNLTQNNVFYRWCVASFQLLLLHERFSETLRNYDNRRKI